MEQIRIEDIGKVAVNSVPFHDKEEDEDHTREKFSFGAIDTELAKVDAIRAAGNEGKMVSVIFEIID
jgi:hypothetical protein